LRQARYDTVVLHDSSAGDNGWSLGCRVYVRTCYALQEAAKEYDWLTILREDERPLRFVFAIGSIPIRFYRGEPVDPPARYLYLCYAELRQRQTALDFGVPLHDGQMFRIAVETDFSGQASNVTLVEMNEANEIVDTYLIPADEGKYQNVIPLQSKGIELPPPTVEPLMSIEEKERKERDAG
jgi:hypothetical protein